MSKMDIPVEDMVRLICEHALATEYATNPLSNFVLRLFRSQLAELQELKLGSIEEYMQDRPESFVPGVVETVRDLVNRGVLDKRTLGAWFLEAASIGFKEGRLLTDYLEMAYEERKLDELIKDEAFMPAINARPH